MKISGIYKIQSVIKPERIYIGSAVVISTRWDNHLSRLRLNKHPNRKLQNHFNKYGEADLSFSILLGCDKEYLIVNEQFFIDSYKPYFNLRPKAENNLGCKYSFMAQKRRKRKPCSEETKKLMREIALQNGNKPPSRKGIKAFEETRLKMSIAKKGNRYLLGYKQSPEHIEKKAAKLRGRISPVKGRKMSEESSMKKRESMLRMFKLKKIV